jgi:mono/diheme cytochrome c family protein
VNFITRVAGIGLIICLPLVLDSVPRTAPAATLVSYGRQIAPILALHCAGCHGLSNPSSNLQVTRFASLRAGGNIGDEIVPGYPEKSILLDFIEGKRGPRQRMPQNARALSPAQIASIRQWIREGAINDNAEGPCFDLRLGSVPASSGKPFQVRSRIAVPALLILSVRDPKSGRELFVDEGSVNSPKEAGNLAGPGEWFSRTLIGEQGWPSSVSVEVRIQYAPSTPNGSVLDAEGQNTSKLLRSVCRPL